MTKIIIDMESLELLDPTDADNRGRVLEEAIIECVKLRFENSCLYSAIGTLQTANDKLELKIFSLQADIEQYRGNEAHINVRVDDDGERQ